jgi:hypothetical protein
LYLHKSCWNWSDIKFMSYLKRVNMQRCFSIIHVNSTVRYMYGYKDQCEMHSKLVAVLVWQRPWQTGEHSASACTWLGGHGQMGWDAPLSRCCGRTRPGPTSPPGERRKYLSFINKIYKFISRIHKVTATGKTSKIKYNENKIKSKGWAIAVLFKDICFIDGFVCAAYLPDSVLAAGEVWGETLH